MQMAMELTSRDEACAQAPNGELSPMAAQRQEQLLRRLQVPRDEQ